MNLDAILEVAIGLVVSWLTLSVAAMQVQEWVSTAQAWRAKYLDKAIRNLLGSDQLANEFYNHPLIQSLSEPGKNPGEFKKPSYIPASKFSAVLMDIFTNYGKDSSQATPGTMTVEQMAAGIQNVKQTNPRMSKILDHLFPNLNSDTANAEQIAATARIQMEAWFNDGMDRLTGWYKRHTAYWAFVIGMVIALTFNVDSVQIASSLWKAPTVRQALVAQATSTSASAVQPTQGLSAFLRPQDYANSLAIPLGWSTAPLADQSLQCGWTPGQDVHPYIWLQNQCNLIVNLPAMNDIWGWLTKLIGILISGAAAAQGAPFWFDILKKLVNVRGSGSAPVVMAPAPVVPAATPIPSPIPAPQTPPPATPANPSTPQPVG